MKKGERFWSATDGSSSPGLAWLLGNIEPERFFRDYFETKFLHAANRPRRYYDHLFKLPDLERIILQSPELAQAKLQFAQTENGVTRIIRPTGLALDPATPKGTLFAEVAAAYRNGQTVTLVEVERAWLPLARLCHSLEAETLALVWVNLYWTPPNARGLREHVDTHDTVILQISGQKRWTIRSGTVPLPMRGMNPPVDAASAGEQVNDLTLRAGDLLYIPRGFVHSAETTNADSLHLTIAIEPYLWQDLIRDLVSDAAEGEVELRGSVPLPLLRRLAQGGAADAAAVEKVAALLSRLLARASLSDAARRYVRNLVTVSNPLDLPLAPPKLPAKLSADFILARRPGVISYVMSSGAHALIGFPGALVRGPAKIAPALAFIAAVDRPFRLSEMPGELSPRAKEVLARRLVRDGLLCVPRQRKRSRLDAIPIAAK